MHVYQAALRRADPNWKKNDRTTKLEHIEQSIPSIHSCPNKIDIEACKRYRYDPSKLAVTKQSIVGHMVIGYLKEYETVKGFNEDKYLHLSDKFYRYGFVINSYKRMKPIRNAKGQQIVFIIN